MLGLLGFMPLPSLSPARLPRALMAAADARCPAACAVPAAAMERMAAEAPQALNVLQMAVCRANTLDLSNAAAQHQQGGLFPK